MRYSLILASILGLSLCACETGEEKPDQDESRWKVNDSTEGSQDDVEANAEQMSDDLKDGANDLKDDAEGQASDMIEGAKSEADEGVDAMEKAANDMSDDAMSAMDDALKGFDVKSMLDGTMSVASLQDAVGSLSSDGLTGLASQLTGGLEGKMAEITGLTEKLSGEGLSATVKEQLQGQLDGLTLDKDDLQEKLSVVVNKMTDGGMDVSKFTGLLGGN